MSGTVGRKRDKFFGRLPFRSSPSSQPMSLQPSVPQPPAAQPPLTTASSAPAQPSAITNNPTGQAVGGASSAKDAAFLENVLGRLTEEQRSTLNSSHAQSPGDVDSTLTAALQAAENKKQLCISKQWTLKIGSRTISTREKAEKVVELLEKFKRVGDVIAGADPIHIGLPWAGVSLILEVAAGEKQQMDAVLAGIATALSMHRTLDVYLAFFHTLPSGTPATALELALVETYATVLGFLATSIDLLAKGSITRFWAALLGGGELQQFGSTCLAAGRQVEVAASNCDRSLDASDRATIQECKGVLDLLLGDVEAIKNQTARIELSISLAKLPRASTAAFDSTDEERMPRCLKSTRLELLFDIQKWVQDPGSAQFFWLQGVAGTGKSTVARTIANIFNDHQILGASFFFKRGHAERGSADLFFATIAVQLAQRIPGLDGAIAQLLSEEVGVYRKGIHTQFRDLILSPLQATSQSRHATRLELVILIDALDECDNDGDRKDDTKQILECLAQLKGVHGLRLRLIVTSRLEFPVEVGFAALGSDSHDDILLHELPRNEIERDIRIFIEAEFEQLRLVLSQRRRREVLYDGWPGGDIVQDLTKRSVPLFIFASTVCSFVADVRFTPQDQLKKVLDDRNPVQLSSTYLLVLQAMIPTSKNGTGEDWDVRVMENFRKIVGLIVFSTEPPSIRTIALLLDLTTDQVEATLDNLHSVLDVTNDLDRPVRPFHLSFIEFLSRPKIAHSFQIDRRATDGLLAENCMAIMMQSNGLQQDICQVRKSGTRRLAVDTDTIESHIPPALSYACRYWVHHLDAASVVVDDQHNTISLLSGWFLYWHEAMSWLGKASDVPRTLRKLQALTRGDGASETINMIADAYEFARYNQYIADLAPLQLYASALVFAPDISIIKTRFRLCMPSWLLSSPRIEKSWRSDVLKFEGHTSVILAMAFSPDDKLLGTCSDDGTARVWDTTDTNCLLTLSHDKSNCCPDAVAFSSDSSKVAVAYLNFRKESTIKVVVIVYSTRTGSLLRTMQCSGLLSHSLRLAVAFEDADNDAVVAVVAHVDQVQVWRVNEAKMFARAWTSHFDRRSGSQSPIDVGISQDGSLLSWSGVGVSDENDDVRSSISVLDPKTRGVTRRHDWEEESDGMSFSGSTLVCQVKRFGGAPRFCLESLDVEDPGETCHLLESQWPWRAFSLANAKNRVAFSLSDDFVVHVEAIPESKRVGKQGFMERQVAVAPRGDLVADWNHERLTLLDAQGIVTQEIKDDFQSLRCLAISPDCRYIALGDKQGVTIWNIKTGRRSQHSEIKDLCVLAFSNDNERLACAGASVSVWDLESEPELVSNTAFRVRRSDRLEFSADGQDLLTRRDRFHIATRT